MIVEPVTLPPAALVRDALELMAHYKISGVPDHRRRRRARRHPHEPRPALRERRRAAGVGADDRRATSSPPPSARRSPRPRSILHRHKIEKLPVVDADGSLRGLITVKDIQKKVAVPAATKDDARAAARRRRGRRRAGRARARAGARSRPARTSSSSTPRTATRAGVLEMVRTDQGRVSGRHHRREHRHRRGGTGAVEAGADAVKARRRSWLLCGRNPRTHGRRDLQEHRGCSAGERVINMNGEPVTVCRRGAPAFVRSWPSGMPHAPGETVVTADHNYFVGDLSTVARETVSAAGYAKVLEKPTKAGLSKLDWKEIGAAEDDVLLLPREIAFELPEHISVDLAEYARPACRARPLPDRHRGLLPARLHARDVPRRR